MSNSFKSSCLILAFIVLVTTTSGPVGLFGDEAAQTPTANRRKTQDGKSRSANEMRMMMSLRKVFDLKSRSPAEMRIIAALDEETEIEFTDTPLADAMEFLSELHNITIILDEEALREDGISPDEPLNRILSGISLRSVLKILLTEYGLTNIIKDDVLQVTTKIVADAMMETRVYNIRNLGTAQIDSERLADVIESTIAPDTWSRSATAIRFSSDGKTVSLMNGDDVIELWRIESGKPRMQLLQSRLGTAAIRPIPNAVVVRQSQSVHREIIDLLKQLELLARLTQQAAPETKQR